jgi:hypothetical protein
MKIQSKEEADFARYWRDRFKNDAMAASTGLCFRLLSTRTRRTYVDASSAAAADLDRQIKDYERTTKP